ncbi:MAG: uridine kinase family protein [Xenococcaceae cyanobacterium]
MNDVSESLLAARNEIVAKIQSLLLHKAGSIVVALDGGSGAGKSTLAASIENELDIALIPLDNFFSANIPDRQWDRFTVEEKLNNVFDWKQLRNCAINPLFKGDRAKWYAFDFELQRPDGTYEMQTDISECKSSNVILIEGAYSASPALSDSIDLAILVDVPVEERHLRLNARENDKDFLEKWHKRWDEVEAHYFDRVRPKSFFDSIVTF